MAKVIRNEDGRLETISDGCYFGPKAEKTNDRSFAICGPVANILEGRMKKHGLDVDQYLWRLMKRHDL